METTIQGLGVLNPLGFRVLLTVLVSREYGNTIP